MFPQVNRGVGPTSLNTNRSPFTVALPDVQVEWRDGRTEEAVRTANRTHTGRLHQEDPEYRRAALEGLARARESRRWQRDAIVVAFRQFHAKVGRWPAQEDLRSANGLPSYGVVRRVFGGLPRVVTLAQM